MTETQARADRGDPSTGAWPPPAELTEAPDEWEFFAAVRAIIAANPGFAGPGRAARIEEELIRFKQRPTTRFEPAPMVEASWAERGDQQVLEIVQTFFGPLGPRGPLPMHVTMDAIRETRRGRPWLAEFLDVFTHRITSFLYRGWESAQLTASRELDADDPYPAWIGSLFGQGAVPFRERDTLPDDVKRYASGWLASGRRSAAGVESIIELVVGAPVAVREFVPEWLNMPTEEQTQLGVQGATLGSEAMIGPRYYSVQSQFRVRSARLTFEQFAALLPDGERHVALRDAVRNLMGLAPAWSLQLVLARDEVPPLALDGTRRLGWDSWAPQEDRAHDPDDVTLIGTYNG